MLEELMAPDGEVSITRGRPGSRKLSDHTLQPHTGSRENKEVG